MEDPAKLGEVAGVGPQYDLPSKGAKCGGSINHAGARQEGQAASERTTSRILPRGPGGTSV